MPDYLKAEEFILDKLRSELSPQLSYHGMHHVLDVLEAAQRIAVAEGLDANEIKLLRIAVCYHDAGFLSTYHGHEEVGCEMARQNLPAYGFTEKDIDKICGMIMATHLPQNPLTLAEKVIADADLDYLGREDFYTTGETLFREFQLFLGVKDENEWNEIQLRFLRNHSYHTNYSQRTRGGEKEKRLAEIEALVHSP